MITIKGIAASQGYAIGPAFVYNPKTVEITDKKVEDTQAEWKRLSSAVDQAVKQLENSYKDALDEEVRVILSTNSDFFKYLKQYNNK